MKRKPLYMAGENMNCLDYYGNQFEHSSKS